MTSVTNNSEKYNDSVKYNNSAALNGLPKVIKSFKSTHYLSHTKLKLPSKIFAEVAKAAVTATDHEKKRKSSQANKPTSTNTKEVNNLVAGVTVEGSETLTAKQRQNLQKQLIAYQDKIKASIKDGSFDEFIEMAFSRKVDNPAELEALKQAVKDGNWDKVIPKIKLGDQDSFNTARASGKKVDAMGAFIKGSEENGGMGTIILNKELLNGPITRNGQTISLQDILTEEIGHSWDVKLNKGDSDGDEGEALSILFKMTKENRKNYLNIVEKMKAKGMNVDDLLKSDMSINADVRKAFKAVKEARAENDNGTMTITNDDGTTSEIEVEFGWLKKAFNKVKKAVRKVVKTVTKFYTMPLRIAADILPAGNMLESMVDTIDDAVDDALDFAEELADKAYEQADKAWKKFEKDVLQSKWLGPVLMVMSFIPVLGTVAMVAQLALAAYQIGKGIETGNMGMVIGGVMSAVGGATAGGLVTGATATTMATAAKTAYGVYNGVEAAKRGDWAGVAGAAVSVAASTNNLDAGTASNITQGINVAVAIENEDYVGAFTSGVALAGNTGIIEKDTAKNIQKTVKFGKAIDDGDASAAIRIGTGYVQNTDWAKENPEAYSALETGSSIYSVIEDEDMSEAEKAQAISKTLYDKKIINQETYKKFNKGTDLYEIVKGDKTDAEKVAAISNYLYDQNLIDENLNNNINTGSNIYGVVKSDKTNAEKAAKVSEYLYDTGAIEYETYDTVRTGLGAYNIAKGDGNSAEKIQQMNDYLFEKNVIGFDTHSTINNATVTFDNTKSDNEKTKAYFELLQKFKIIDPETQNKLNELVSDFGGNTDEIIAKITSDKSTLLNSETKKTVKESYELYAKGEQTYNTVTGSNTAEQVKLFTESSVKSGAMDQKTADKLTAYYESGKNTYDIVTKGSTKERVELLIDSGMIDKKTAEELYAFYEGGQTITNGSTSERVKLLINSGVLDETIAKELYTYYEAGKDAYDMATNGIAA